VTTWVKTTSHATTTHTDVLKEGSIVLKSLLKSLISLLKNRLFLVTVLIPTTLAVVYFGFIASDIYISESRFVVRSPQRQQSGSVLGAILSGSGFARSQDDAFSVHDYIMSRDALVELDKKLEVRKAFSSTQVDFASKFPGVLGEDSFESLHKYYSKQVSISHDSSSNISTLRVHAFDAEQAYGINELLLVMGERLVNQINDRGRQDLVKYAQTEVTEAELKAKQAALALAGFRNQRSVFDPDRQSALQLQQVSKLQDELIATKMQLIQVRSLSPENPQLPVLQKRAEALQREMDQEMAKVAGGGTNSLTNKSADFERLTLERAFADRQLASSMTSLESARNEARRKALYLERIVQPNKPDVAVEPRRLRAIFTVLMMGLIAWGILNILLAGVREHKD
jgi:capsular polysaccharide transport system permease protein